MKLTGSEAAKWTILVAVIVTMVRGVFATILPPVQDEAYYFLWSKALDLGYFDHPPGVALMAATSRLGESFFLARLGTLAASGVAALFIGSLIYNIGIRERNAFLTALVATNGTLAGLVAGFLTTPDTALLLCWTIALHEAVFAVRGGPYSRRWLTAGVATGLGLLSKYTMTIIGPVFLYGLWRQHQESRKNQQRTAFRSPWPYLGGLLALLLFLPNVWWNAENDWITFRFQMRHGFSLDRPDAIAYLPEPLPFDPLSHEATLGGSFAALTEATLAEEQAPRWYDVITKPLNRYIGYYAAQLGFWGFLLWPLFFWYKQRKAQTTPSRYVVADSAQRGLMIAAIVAPLLVFGTISLFAKAEANWSAMYLVAAVPLAIAAVARHQKKIYAAVALNIAVLLLAAVHAAHPFLPVRAHKDRLVRETHGYASLASHLKGLKMPVFADSYQLVAMTRIRQPDLLIRQWPGITRDSEFTRNKKYTQISMQELIGYGSFALVTTELTPPRIRGFQATDLSQIRDCLAMDLQIITKVTATEVEERCRHPVHEWYLIQYEAI